MKLYMGNLPFRATEEDIQEWFHNSGITADVVTIIRDRMTTEPRGFGFVEINDEAQANTALRVCNGMEMMGRTIVINEAHPVGSGNAGGMRGNRGSKTNTAPRGRW
jgi:RNA recognition motif-containing protein